MTLTLPKSSSRLQSAPQKWAMIFLNALLVVVMVYDLLRLSGILFAQPAAVTSLSLMQDNLPKRESVVRPSIPGGWYPFGQEMGDPEAQKSLIPDTAPDTALNLTLMGVFHFEDSKHPLGLNHSARALIKGANMAEKSVRLQETLPGNILIAAIFSDHVILKHNNQFETLRLPRKRLDLPIIKDEKPRPGHVLQQLRKTFLEDPNQALSQIRIEPLYQAGAFKGYQLFPGKTPDLFKQLGLVAGDIVTRVNEISLESAADGLRAISDLANKRSWHVRVLRSGTIKNFDFIMDP